MIFHPPPLEPKVLGAAGGKQRNRQEGIGTEEAMRRPRTGVWDLPPPSRLQRCLLTHPRGLGDRPLHCHQGSCSTPPPDTLPETRLLHYGEASSQELHQGATDAHKYAGHSFCLFQDTRQPSLISPPESNKDGHAESEALPGVGMDAHQPTTP